jgi:hypothetical protein
VFGSGFFATFLTGFATFIADGTGLMSFSFFGSNFTRFVLAIEGKSFFQFDDILSFGKKK